MNGLNSKGLISDVILLFMAMPSSIIMLVVVD